MDGANKKINRRSFFKLAGTGTAITAAAFTGCSLERADARGGSIVKEVPKGLMTYRPNPKTKEQVSLLGYGMMRLPNKTITTENGSEEVIDQDAVNDLVDYAIEHGVNYFDTSPVYCKGKSEESTGIALKRHPREKYFIATKLSNFDGRTHNREASLAMYNNSFKELQVDYIDYLLLHGIGMGGMDALNSRYIDNGVLDFLIEERKKGRIRNLGFSYHGDIKVYDYLLSRHDEIKWDFVQIQMNYVDWENAKLINPRNTNAKYLYEELEKRDIPVVIMEPLLGGRLASLNFRAMSLIRQVDTENSIASWAFRYAGTPDKILTVLSGMTYMEHLQDNIRTYSPLKPIEEKEYALLDRVTKTMFDFHTINCTNCQYCMPCPYGLDIPTIFAHYNKCLNEGNFTDDAGDVNYKQARKAFLIGYDRTVPKLRQANHCIGCDQCSHHCPQRIDIPKELHSIDRYVEDLKQNA